MDYFTVLVERKSVYSFVMREKCRGKLTEESGVGRRTSHNEIGRGINCDLDFLVQVIYTYTGPTSYISSQKHSVTYENGLTVNKFVFVLDSPL